MDSKIEVTIVSPVFNEEENILAFAKSIVDIMQENKWNWELILVDDGSTDETAINLEQCLKLSDSIRVLTLSKNFGQTPAIQAGFLRSNGKYLITLDSDL